MTSAKHRPIRPQLMQFDRVRSLEIHSKSGRRVSVEELTQENWRIDPDCRSQPNSVRSFQSTAIRPSNDGRRPHRILSFSIAAHHVITTWRTPFLHYLFNRFLVVTFGPMAWPWRLPAGAQERHRQLPEVAFSWPEVNTTTGWMAPVMLLMALSAKSLAVGL